jgi:hypothetical protein
VKYHPIQQHCQLCIFSTFDDSEALYGDLPDNEVVTGLAEVLIRFPRFFGVTMTKVNTNKIITIIENLLKHPIKSQIV